MLRTKDMRTGCLFEPFAHLGPKRLKRVEGSWAGVFRRHVLPALPVDRPRHLYSRRRGLE